MKAKYKALIAIKRDRLRTIGDIEVIAVEALTDNEYGGEVIRPTFNRLVKDMVFSGKSLDDYYFREIELPDARYGDYSSWATYLFLEHMQVLMEKRLMRVEEIAPTVYIPHPDVFDDRTIGADIYGMKEDLREIMRSYGEPLIEALGAFLVDHIDWDEVAERYREEGLKRIAKVKRELEKGGRQS